jgi:hypothetical protein
MTEIVRLIAGNPRVVPYLDGGREAPLALVLDTAPHRVAIVPLTIDDAQRIADALRDQIKVAHRCREAAQDHAEARAAAEREARARYSAADDLACGFTTADPASLPGSVVTFDEPHTPDYPDAPPVAFLDDHGPLLTIPLQLDNGPICFLSSRPSGGMTP